MRGPWSLIAVATVVGSVFVAGCANPSSSPTSPSSSVVGVSSPPPPPPPSTTVVTVEFGGRVVNADTGDPVANVRISLGDVGGTTSTNRPPGYVFPTNTAASGGDGTFALPLDLPSNWTMVGLQFTGPAGYDDTHGRFEPDASCASSPCWAAADRPAIGMYPTLVIRPGESIEVRVQPDVYLCDFFGTIDCRRVLVEASPGEPIELELVPHDASQPMGLAKDDWDETSAPRLLVAPGGVAYVHGPGTARLTARR